ncbi:c-type cytochrome, methanol metabolism-related [Aurantimonas sp. C2-6-R+9]|uniref:c-type cytochrome, methanol metabolism-related n=1 Tax=unclassified Aurantimonas TaxID=2638230 RepID=UPI002E174AFA|nr:MULTISPECIES: c-type cytochrome, methanol metabolism-related [unclassified Aurantimonas]MEC5291905.1 c-type cytochrome, methanol metabolism-related [Aurantimonas sp. C2-3-R2]MEC5379876.1 c-type cytochrome, methanol metabolism-related [Aurantimonas sp. C2-6-R+9]MEC5412991.1 c-type cytochrome, methanol metabolism-related [Aurantimonas sp. C2-4-R8]
MNSKLIAFAGIVLLSASSLTFAQSDGTTIVPAGQQAPDAAKPAADAPVTADDTTTTAKEAPAQASTASGEKAMASGETMKVDAHPSKDTASEGNQPSEGEEGKFVDPAGNPTYSMTEDGTADWYTWRGYKKYGANCLQCHGPDGLGSSFAPNLTESLQTLSYFDFVGVVVSGQQNQWNSSGNSIMPAWGEDPNVMCSLDAIYIYLRARTDGVVGRGEPKRPAKNEAGQKAEYDCLGF